MHIFDGEWLDGLREGKGLIKYFDGTLKEQFWKNGVLMGQGLNEQTSAPLLPSLTNFINV